MNNTITNDFTIRTANQTLPLVQLIVQDIVELSAEIDDTRERLDYLTEGRNSDEPLDEYAKELNAVELITEQKADRLNQFKRELVGLNVNPAGSADGFADFPARREDQPVCLCWKLGEREVMFWHGANENCSTRQPIDLPLIRQSGERQLSNLN